MKIFKNAQEVNSPLNRYSHIVSVTPKKISKYDDFTGFTFRKVSTLILTTTMFHITDEDFGTHSYSFKDFEYHIK